MSIYKDIEELNYAIESINNDENKTDEEKQLNKSELKEFLKDNTCEGAEIVESESIVIK